MVIKTTRFSVMSVSSTYLILWYYIWKIIFLLYIRALYCWASFWSFNIPWWPKVEGQTQSWRSWLWGWSKLLSSVMFCCCNARDRPHLRHPLRMWLLPKKRFWIELQISVSSPCTTFEWAWNSFLLSWEFSTIFKVEFWRFNRFGWWRTKYLWRCHLHKNSWSFAFPRRNHP